MIRLRPVTVRTWKKLFLFCLGLAAGAAFCMKWIEGDFHYDNSTFSIIGIEITYSRPRLAALFVDLQYKREALQSLYYHLSFDFAFMAGVYPGITALCMIGREKVGSVAIRKLLFVIAWLQLVAWGSDIAENCFLFKWLWVDPYSKDSGWLNTDVMIPANEYMIYHIVVWLKWILALGGVLVAIPYALRKRKPGF